MKENSMDVFNTYNNALAQGDFNTVFNTMADTVTWHQPGNNPLSGTITGKEALSAHLAKFAEKSNNTFRVATNWAASNKNLIAAHVNFLADRGNGEILNMAGIDLFRIENGKIQEVWLFSSSQVNEDKYWS